MLARWTRWPPVFRRPTRRNFASLLTLLSYFTDPKSIPLLGRVYAAPDSFGVPSVRHRASDALLWIGQRRVSRRCSMHGKRLARGGPTPNRARPGGYDFLANDSSRSSRGPANGFRVDRGAEATMKLQPFGRVLGQARRLSSPPSPDQDVSMVGRIYISAACLYASLALA